MGAEPRAEDETVRAAREPGRTAAGLYVVATPIGNLGDISERAAAILASVDLVACEDTRQTGKLLRHLGVRRRPMRIYNDHTGPQARPELLARLEAGAAVALVSDAGTPCISDPGYRLVREATERGIPVHAVPGASAVMAALSISGLPTDRFFFAGFLPPRSAARRAVLAELAPVRATLVLLETAPRLAALLQDAGEVLGAREAVVAREITKLFEERRPGSLPQLAAHYATVGPPKGEITIVIGPPALPDAAVEQDPDLLDAQLVEAAARLPPRSAAAAVAASTGIAANRLYARLMVLRARSSSGKEDP